LTVAFRNAETLEVLGRVAIPEASGAFAIEGLENMPYLLELTDFDGRYAPEDAHLVRPGDAPIEIVLEPRH
jgi:hypothetical protein